MMRKRQSLYFWGIVLDKEQPSMTVPSTLVAFKVRTVWILISSWLVVDHIPEADWSLPAVMKSSIEKGLRKMILASLISRSGSEPVPRGISMDRQHKKLKWQDQKRWSWVSLQPNVQEHISYHL